MPVISWKEDFLTGDSVVDSQHRALCKMLGDLHDALTTKRDEVVVVQLLDALERYMLRHFSAERQLMESSGYPATARHVAQHEQIAKKCREMMSAHRAGTLAIGVTLTQFVTRWLSEHIIVEDKRMVQWSRLNGGFAASSGQFPTRDSAKLVAVTQADESRTISGTLAVDTAAKWAARDSLRQIVAARAVKSKS